MRNLRLLGLFVLLIAILYACNFGRNAATPTAETSLVGDLPAIGLTVQAQNGNSTFNTVGQVINYVYSVTNTGNTVIVGPVSITDDKAAATCPNLNTIGNLDNNFDPAENITCASAYTITQADLNAGAVTSNATATVGGIGSNRVTTTVPMTPVMVLTLTSVPNPTTYNQANQTITFTYTITNTGTPTLGPAQFVIKDDKLGTINCGGADTTLANNGTLPCTATYTTTQNDLAVQQLTFNTSALGGGAGSPPIAVNVTNTGAAGGPSANYTKGTTITHQVNDGEWMLQIARCYGADFTAVRNANPQVIDPDQIWPIDRLTVPNIGSNGTIYGPPCVTYYTAVTGDTWQSIATKYNADLAVLMEANKGLTVANGVKLKIPLNSAGGTTVPPQSTPTTSQPTRINIPSGSTTTSVSGTVNPQSTVRYVLAATQGQTLNVKVTSTATAGEVGLAVYSPANAVLKPMDATLTWSGTIPANGDHFIDISSLSGSTIKSFTLEVGLVTPPPPATSNVERAADINVGAGDSNPSYLSVFNGVLYFRADGNDGAGTELWKYDGATKTASRVADTNVGAGGSDPAFLTSFNSALYFSANGNDGAGVELWRYNGTNTGRMPDINNGNNGADNSNPAYMAVFNNILYFSANGNDGAGVELWKTDGNTVSRAANIYPDSGDSNPAHLAVFNGALYFSATSNDGAGTELWKFDGTNATRVADINNGVGSSAPAYLTVFNNLLYFSANGNDGAGVELWKFDGTNATRVTDINKNGDSVPAYLCVFNGALYFSATGSGEAGFELWKFDGTEATRVADINKSGDSFPSYLTVFNNELYFQANGGDNAGKELWKFKGP